MGLKPKELGKCKNCYCSIGRLDGRLVHVRNLREACGGNNGPKKAQLKGS